MKYKPGDRFIAPNITIIQTPYDQYHATIGGYVLKIPERILDKCRKVLGLLGDKGLEAQVGMKVYCDEWGDGEIIQVDQHGCMVSIEWQGDKNYYRPYRCECYSMQGKRSKGKRSKRRFIYVTKLPKPPPEPFGYAWVKQAPPDGPFTADGITQRGAEHTYGDRLLLWVPKIEE